MTTSNKTFKNLDSVKEYLNNLDCSELVSIHNEYCQSTNNSDDEIFINDEDFFNTFFDGKVLEAVRAVSFGEYSYSHDYVVFNGYANLETFNNPTDKVDIESIASDILENPENYQVVQRDKNIDFRRVKNLNVYFKRHALSLTLDIYDLDKWQGGDIVIFKKHIGIVSNYRNKKGITFVIHHAYPHQLYYEEDILEKRNDIIGHYRIS